MYSVLECPFVTSVCVQFKVFNWEVHSASLVKFLCTTAMCHKLEEFHSHNLFNVALWLQALFYSKRESILDEKITTVLSSKLQTLCLIIAFFVCIFSRIFLTNYVFSNGQNYGQSCMTELYDRIRFLMYLVKIVLIWVIFYYSSVLAVFRSRSACK